MISYLFVLQQLYNVKLLKTKRYINSEKSMF